MVLIYRTLSHLLCALTEEVSTDLKAETRGKVYREQKMIEDSIDEETYSLLRKKGSGSWT